MFLEIITPDETVFEGEVESATFSGSNGKFQILNNHAPLVSSLVQGDLSYNYLIDKKIKQVHLSIDDGVVEVFNNKTLVLVEHILD